MPGFRRSLHNAMRHPGELEATRRIHELYMPGTIALFL
jgi:hypothetical protein